MEKLPQNLLTTRVFFDTISRLLTVAIVGKALWRRSLDGYSGRFIPGRSLVRIRPPLPTWLLGQAVKTSPFHGGNTSSILVGVTNGELAQLGEHLPYKQGVTGSSPVLPTKRHIRAHLAPFLHVSRSVIYAQ